MELLEQLRSIPLQFAVFTFEISPIEEMILPAYPATTLRGGLGYSLKNRTCLKDEKTCKNECENKQRCIFSNLYESKSGETVDGSYIPYMRPYIIRTGFIKKRKYFSQDSFKFELILFGDAIQHYPFFISAMVRFGQKGIGVNQSPFSLKKVTSHTPFFENVIFDGVRLCSKPFINKFNHIDSSMFSIKANEISLTFLSPLRMQFERKYIEKADFVHIVDNLLKRTQSLLYHHHNKHMISFNTDDILDKAFEIQTAGQTMERTHLNRFSTRQKSDVHLDGLLGNITFTGKHLTELLPLLYLGQFLHLGKQTAFGLGQYKISIVD
jgi:CRISPR-associated endoribonuclease Cas6